MPSRLQILVDLLHSAGEAALATHSATVPGHPFATSVQFATDEHHRPVMLVSGLAEHTRNLDADARASLLVARTLGAGEIARVSLVGEVRPIVPDAAMVARYLRYHPEAERFLQFGDFRFRRFEPERVLVVGGFAKAGWRYGAQMLDAPHIPLDVELRLLEAMAPDLPDGMALLGVDAYGADTLVDGTRRRIPFPDSPVMSETLPTALRRALAN